MNDRDFRLPKSVMPARYDLRIEVDLDRWRFDASEHIEVTIERPTAEIFLHAVDLEIRSVQAVTSAATQRATVNVYPDADTIGLRFADALPAGRARLDIDFAG